MNHNFSKSGFTGKCVICQQDDIAHTDKAKCEVCDKEPCKVEVVNNILMCIDCEQKEMDARLSIIEKPKDNDINPAGLNQIKPNIYDETLANSRQADLSIAHRSDLFNAHTVSIEELRLAINANPEIPEDNKHFKLAETLKERFLHFQSIIFEHQAVIVDAGNAQKAIQVYLNNLANKLRSEEREKLKLADITYQVKPVGPIKTPKVSKPKPKFNKADVDKVAESLSKEFNKPIPAFMVQTVAVSNNCDAEQAGNIIRRNLKEAMSI